MCTKIIKIEVNFASKVKYIRRDENNKSSKKTNLNMSPKVDKPNKRHIQRN